MDLLRLRTSLTETVENELNEQIKIEGKSSANYLAMASWCERNGFENSAEFFYAQSDEERDHMMRIFRYVNEVGGAAYSPEITNVAQEYDSFRGVFEVMLEQEISVSRAINHLLDVCTKEKDHATAQFLLWFVEEQREEEKNARRILELFDVIGEEGTGRFMIDKEIGKLIPAAE